MKEWDTASWRKELEAAEAPFALFVHTPLCGTCSVARRMLGVACEVLPGLPIAAANLNVMPELAERFRIQSVPCLLLWERKGEVRNAYRFGSVQELVELLRPLRIKAL
ncbi:thioredoxin family protein [Cohnella massiliensis]|uniref:thioredoxin family protein n=1 Tax=Cohnella massiliensis TaxID=1816691 RepID=UPI0009BBF81F|nr:thioredoxin family protein [Cohnella massiliensis]